jgi:4-hydroxyphenylpyruvate dioxygenase
MKPCISEATTMAASFAEDVQAFAGAGFRAMEVWLTKLETHLESHSLSETRRLLEDQQMALAAASYQGGLLVSQGEQRHVHFDHFRRRLELCQGLGISLLLVIADYQWSKVRNPKSEIRNPKQIPSTKPQIPNQAEADVANIGISDFGFRASDLERSVVSLKQAAQWAAGFDVRLGLEFRGSAPFCSSLSTAIALVDQCGEPNLGINFDAFHYYTGPSKQEDFDLLTRENLAFVQLSDLTGVPRELARDADRILPGDGEFQLTPILERFRAMGYDGYVSLELMNPVLWQMKPSQVAEMGMKALTRLIQ